MRVEFRDALENLFADAQVSAPPCRAVTLDVARGGIAAVHVLCDQVPEGAQLKVALRQNGRLVRTARWFRLLDVPVEENTGLNGFTESNHPGQQNPHVVRRAPFRTFDAMEPVQQIVRAASSVLALRVHLPIPPDARTGIQVYSIELDTPTQTDILSLIAQVHKAVVPPVGKSSFPYTNWFSYEVIAERHRVRLWSEPYWKMLARYAAIMAHARQNTFWIPLSVIFEKRGQQHVLNRERLRRIVKTFSAAGLHWIEGGHVAGRTGGKWDATSFDLVLGGPGATSIDGNAKLASLTRQLMAEIDRNGWRERWIQHIADEPIACNAADYRILAGMVRKYMPGVPILDAVLDTGLAGAVDIWCPQVQQYQEKRQQFDAQRGVGDRIWYYTCCCPGGPWLNRLLDHELLRPALLGWAGALFSLHGFLHWGFNHYQREQDPFAKSIIRNWGGGANSLPAGDTHIVYPGADGPWSSLRLEAHREGFEDLELLKQLQSKSPRAARAVLRKAVRGFDDYLKDVREFRAARKALLQGLC